MEASVDYVAQKRALRRETVREQKKRSRQAKAQAEAGMKSWSPGSTYTLLQAGEELPYPPHEMWTRKALQPRHLFHFRSNDPNAKRCALVEGLSKYESVFRLKGAPPDQYVIPIHEHLEQATQSLDVGRAEEILESGVPYFPDKRLRRLRDEGLNRKQATNQEKKKRGRGSQKFYMLHLTERHLRAAVPIDNYISSAVSRSTISTQDKNGAWATGNVDLKVLPSQQKMTALMRDLPSSFELIGECTPLSKQEVIARCKAEEERQRALEEEEQQADPGTKTKRRRRRKPPVKDALGTKPGLRRPVSPPSPPPPAMRADESLYAYTSSSEDEYGNKKVNPYVSRVHIPSDDDEWEMDSEERREKYAALAQDDEADDDFGDMALNRQADGQSKPRAAYETLVKRAASSTGKVFEKAQAHASNPTKRAKVTPSPTPELSKADIFVEVALENPAASVIPADWKVIVENNPTDVARQMLKISSHYKMLTAYSSM